VDAEQPPLFLPLRPPSRLPQRRSRVRIAVSVVLSFVLSFGLSCRSRFRLISFNMDVLLFLYNFLSALQIFSGQAWAEGKEELVMCCHRAGGGREGRTKCTPPYSYGTSDGYRVYTALHKIPKYILYYWTCINSVRAEVV